eukprot:6598688-Alexandrium_andersonii.AAC.1
MSTNSSSWRWRRAPAERPWGRVQPPPGSWARGPRQPAPRPAGRCASAERTRARARPPTSRTARGRGRSARPR